MSAAPLQPRLGPGPEFDLIRKLVRHTTTWPDWVRVGPGDDCAVLGPDGLCVSTDLSVEGVHFRRSWLTDEQTGRRAVSAALSDLAAMAALPLGVLTSLGIPRSDASATAEALSAGIRDAAEAHGAPVLGGDVVTSPGPLFLDVVVLGRTESPTLRVGAEPGDEVWVTGELGGSAGAVRMWEQGRVPPEPLQRAFADPEPRLEEARWLAERGLVRAMVDVSDGLVADASHIAAAGGVGILLASSHIPVSTALSAVLGDEQAAQLAFHGGEDFELCIVARKGRMAGITEEFRTHFGVRLTRVGEVVAEPGVFRVDSAGVRVPIQGGFDHFGDRA